MLFFFIPGNPKQSQGTELHHYQKRTRSTWKSLHILGNTCKCYQDKRFKEFAYFQVSLSSAQLERNKTKEQIEEEKRISLSFRIKPLQIEGFSIQKLQSKARELWDAIVKLETEKYDLEERQKRQDYDVSISSQFIISLNFLKQKMLMGNIET